MVKLTAEAQALIHTYLDGAGIVAWRPNKTESGYEIVPVPPAAQVSNLDDVLHRISTEIRNRVAPTGTPPAAITPRTRTVDVTRLQQDDPQD
jgi:hypothetical protein